MPKAKPELSLADKIRKNPKKAKWLASGHLLVSRRSKDGKGFFCSGEELADIIESLQPEAEFVINTDEDTIYRKIDKVKVLEALRVR